MPDARIVFDRFHVARLAQRAVDEVRRAQMRALDPEDRAPVKRTRWALRKHPERLRTTEKAKLDLVRRTNKPLYRAYVDGILAFIDSRLTNARLEGMNNKVRLISHRAFGFHSAEPLIAMIYLCCSNITLPQLHLS